MLKGLIDDDRFKSMNRYNDLEVIFYELNDFR